MASNQLKVINFSAGIFSTPLNENFNTIHDWIKKERLRLGGYGISNGFELSYDNNYGINISSGVLINKDGDEIIINDTNIYCGKPIAEKIEEEIVVEENGKLTLKFKPYSPSNVCLINYDPPTTTVLPDTKEFLISTVDDTRTITPLSIKDKSATISERFTGQTIKVTYYYSNDRIEAIMVKEDSSIVRYAGIESESPSSADVAEQLKTSFLIGFAHWMVNDTVSVEFIIDDRTYRKVYVDEQNRLWLNGKLYVDASLINYGKPLLPADGDFWYDKEANLLYSWSAKPQEWRIVNDFSSTVYRELAFWTPEENPEDLQTFMFDTQDLNLRYIPNRNNLEIIIDHIPIMSDQFEEIVVTSKDSIREYGAGFKLCYPLDKKSYVQCIVHQQGSNETIKNIFQKATIFVDENYIAYSATNINQIFMTDLPYIAGKNQLEVFVNGIKLMKQDFNEMVNQDVVVSKEHYGSKINMFSVTKTLSPGQIVTYKISRYVWSYNDVHEYVKHIENNGLEALERISSLENRFNLLTNNIEEQLNSIKNSIGNQANAIASMNLYRKKTDEILLSDLSSEIKEKLYQNSSTIVFNATEVQDKTFQNCNQGDIFIVSYVNSNSGRRLIEDREYSISFNEDKHTATLSLSSVFMSSENTIYITIIRFGES